MSIAAMLSSLLWSLFPMTCDSSATATPAAAEPFIAVLGIAQDAGYPQAACRRACCHDAWADDSKRRHVACLAIVDPKSGERWMIDCTPDFREQLRRLDQLAPVDESNRAQPGLSGVLLTHAHIGHYTGLIQLGREVTGAQRVPLHVMPRMREFLSTNGPWDQLMELDNIQLQGLAADEPLHLNDRITITPFLVPHRDEYSETVGYRIDGPMRSVLYIPDIDKWDRWDRDVVEVIRSVDVAYLDGTFFENGEIPGRDMALIPHPFIEESMQRFVPLSEDERARVRFIHFNHTNPVLREGSGAREAVEAAGYGIAIEGEVVPL